MRLDKLPVGEAIVGFLLVALVAAFLVARSEVASNETEEDGGSPTASAAPTSPGQPSIVMTDNKFDNTEFTFPAGTEVTIALANHGIAIHNVHIAGEGGDYSADFCTTSGPDPCSDPARMPGGSTGTLAFTVPSTAGAEIPYRCDYHPVEMQGTITVQ